MKKCYIHVCKTEENNFRIEHFLNVAVCMYLHCKESSKSSLHLYVVVINKISMEVQTDDPFYKTEAYVLYADQTLLPSQVYHITSLHLFVLLCMRVSRGGAGVLDPSLENHKYIGVFI